MGKGSRAKNSHEPVWGDQAPLVEKKRNGRNSLTFSLIGSLKKNKNFAGFVRGIVHERGGLTLSNARAEGLKVSSKLKKGSLGKKVGKKLGGESSSRVVPTKTEGGDRNAPSQKGILGKIAAKKDQEKPEPGTMVISKNWGAGAEPRRKRNKARRTWLLDLQKWWTKETIVGGKKEKTDTGRSV